jgi:hypothetical protein
MASEQQRVVMGMDPHKRSVTIEVMDGRRTGLGWRPVRHRRRRLPSDAGIPASVAGPGLGGRGLQRHRSAHRAASAGRRPRGGRRPGQAVGTCPGVLHRAWPQDRRHRRPLDRAGGGRDGWATGRWSMTSSSRCCESWPIGAGLWVPTTPGWSLSCTTCCSSSSGAERRRTSQPPRPSNCWHGSVHATPPAKPDVGSQPS